MKPVTACLALLLFALATTPATAGAASKSPRVIRVRTEPAVSGITLTFKGRRYVTDADGRALIPRPRGMAANQALPRIAVGSRTVDARTVVRFARWFRVGPDSVAALDVFRRVGWRFFDTSGAVVPPHKIGRLVLRSTTGEVRVWRTGLGRSHLLFSRRVTLIASHQDQVVDLLLAARQAAGVQRDRCFVEHEALSVKASTGVEGPVSGYCDG